MVRAGILDYVMSEHIKNRAHEKVILVEEGSDELTQKNFKQTPDYEKGYLESVKLVKNLHFQSLKFGDNQNEYFSSYII